MLGFFLFLSLQRTVSNHTDYILWVGLLFFKIKPFLFFGQYALAR